MELQKILEIFFWFGCADYMLKPEYTSHILSKLVDIVEQLSAWKKFSLSFSGVYVQ